MTLHPPKILIKLCPCMFDSVLVTFFAFKTLGLEVVFTQICKPKHLTA
jgi:hypothetical protein